MSQPLQAIMTAATAAPPLLSLSAADSTQNIHTQVMSLCCLQNILEMIPETVHLFICLDKRRRRKKKKAEFSLETTLQLNVVFQPQLTYSAAQFLLIGARSKAHFFPHHMTLRNMPSQHQRCRRKSLLVSECQAFSWLTVRRDEVNHCAAVTSVLFYCRGQRPTNDTSS